LRPYLEKILHKKKKVGREEAAGIVAQGVGPEFKPQNHKTKKKE
jgi:hypothetical protein